jgi:hypothetical protein
MNAAFRSRGSRAATLDGVADSFDAPLQEALGAGKQLWPLVERSYDQHPRQHDRESTEGVDL